MQNNNSLSEIIRVRNDKCVNCHLCIGACPVKYCNDASDVEEGITIKPNLCIGCGECIKVCTHHAREIVDDTKKFFDDLKHGIRISTLISPATDVNFPNQLENLLGFFKNSGIQRNFDVSFGAEITSYEYFKAYKNQITSPIISQACPCIVNYIETYKPSLIPYLAPTGSPALNTAKWVNKNYPLDKLAFISPCIAKKIEFEDKNTYGLVTYNVTILGLKTYLKNNNINLANFSKIGFDGIIEAEKGILYSQPGGLTESFKQYILPLKPHQIRCIEGINIYEDFFDELETEIINKKCDIALIDILNCSHGCNRGTGTDYNERTTDEALKIQAKRLQKQTENYYNSDEEKEKLKNVLIDLDNIDFSRKYTDKSDFYKNLEEPTQEIIEIINREMGKFDKKDIKDCGTCGYFSCKGMIKAIINGLYRPQQCHHFLESFYKRHSGDAD